MKRPPASRDPNSDLADDLVFCLRITVIRKGIVEGITDQLPRELRPLVLPGELHHDLL